MPMLGGAVDVEDTWFRSTSTAKVTKEMEHIINKALETRKQYTRVDRDSWGGEREGRERCVLGAAVKVAKQN